MEIETLPRALPKSIYRRYLMITDTWPGERANPGSLVIQCYPGGDKTPLFWCGMPDTLTSFGRAFGQDRAIYCICGTFGVLPATQENIDALAYYYAAELVKIQPQGHFLLGGFCEAGFLGYEIARLLQAQGYVIELLFLLDTDVTAQDRWLKLARFMSRRIENILTRWHQIQKEPLLCIREITINKLSQLRRLQAWLINSKSSVPIMQEAAPLYQHAPYPGEVEFVFVTGGLFGYFQFEFFQRYWRRLALGGVQFNFIPGAYHDQPDWQAVTTILESRLPAS